ncbi:helix-turn-helix domain-containing protein [Streptomyces sp. Tu6071]|uniref:helix-turn-helix domain-containing protein n=1 Tax=Streptomyces sp. Tu6071 TaxID=355249 RepID=UPI0005B885AA|nr:helix-turn-helix domain-containing protein [Streptomyces sp. Tu6071]
MGEILRAFRFPLAPTPAQEQRLVRWCGNSRLAFNYASAAKRPPTRTGGLRSSRWSTRVSRRRRHASA